MGNNYLSAPNRQVEVDASRAIGPFEWWRHTLSHGGINTLPLPDKVVSGAAKLKPRLIRTFLQEYLNIYLDHGKYDWSIIDPYMDSLSRTGANVVACICLKPKALFPDIHSLIWRPNDVAEWQTVIYELVKRYSVEKKIVTYWEIGNEMDIGENGGCPYLIENAEDYMEYYKFTIEAVLRAYPEARVGGPAAAFSDSRLFVDFVDLCRRTGTRLDFVSWHVYKNDPAEHRAQTNRIRLSLAEFPSRPEMLVTEMNKDFEAHGVSFQELAMMPRRAAGIAAIVFEMIDDGIDWTFYYHVWDQAFYPEEFAPFYSDLPIMITHWNEFPHRFGMFGVAGEARPQYFVYRMLSMMGEERLHASSDHPGLRVMASASADKSQWTVMLADYPVIAEEAVDQTVTIRLKGLTSGRKELEVFRIDDARSWSEETLELVPVERRELDTIAGYDLRLQVWCPADSVILLRVTDRPREGSR